MFLGLLCVGGGRFFCSLLLFVCSLLVLVPSCIRSMYFFEPQGSFFIYTLLFTDKKKLIC